jgi:hypothetical protein
VYVLVRYWNGDEEAEDLDVKGVEGPFTTKPDACIYGRESYHDKGPWDVFRIDSPEN